MAGISNIFQKLYSAIKIHFRVMFYDFDSVKDSKLYQINQDSVSNQNWTQTLVQLENNNDTKPLKINQHFIFPLFIVFVVILDSLLIFSEANFQYSSNGLPELFFHLIWPRKFWPQSDIMMLSAIGMQLLVFVCLLVDPMLSPKFWMFLFVNDKVDGKVDIVLNGKGIRDSQRGVCTLPIDISLP